MKRKLIQLSPSTSVVSLPAKWVKKNNLKKGTSVILKESDNSIIVSSKEDKAEKEITLDISDLQGKIMWAHIAAAYIAGYDSITLTTKNQSQREFMSKIVKYFPGMIIYEERKNKVRFKDITHGAQEDVDKILNRLFNMNISLLEDASDAMRSKDWDFLMSVKTRDWAINSYIEYCLRQLNKFSYRQFSKTGIMNTYIKIIEMLSDRICELLIKSGEEKIKVSDKVITGIIEMYKQIQSNHFNYSKEKLLEFDNSRTALIKLIDSENKKIYRYLNQLVGLFFEVEELEIQLHM